MWFRPRPIVSDDMQDWIVENFDWVAEHRPHWLRTARLIEPTRSFFAAAGGTSHEAAISMTSDIITILDLDPNIRLEPLPELPDELRHQYGVLSDVAGEYWDYEAGPQIT